MLTARGYRWLSSVAALTFVGLLLGWEAPWLPGLTGLTLLLLLLLQWWAFVWRMEGLRGRLRVRRRIVQGGRQVPTLWPDVPLTVELELANLGRLASPLLWVEDLFVPGVEVTGKEPTRWCVRLAGGASVTLRYRRRVSGPGCIRADGVQVLLTDALGLFRQRWVLRQPQVYWVLPPLCDQEGRQRASKGFNQWPPPGIHRWRRPGTGSELLDLRDYQAGDPPKMIAWKVSARRDQLITKELESDVPVRCVMFLDGSDEMRLGEPGRRPLQQLAHAAGLAGQVAMAQRDPVGLVYFDASGVEVLPPGRTRQHLWRFLERLAQAAAAPAQLRGSRQASLFRHSWMLAEHLYPDLLQNAWNRMPLARLWRPLLDNTWGWLVPAVMLANWAIVLLLPMWRFWCLEQAAVFTRWALPTANGAAHLVLFLLSALVLLFCPLVVAALFWLGYGAHNLWGRRRRVLTRRKQLAALLVFRSGAGPAHIEALLRDEALWTAALARFLQEHHVSVPVQWWDLPQRQLYRQPEKITVLAAALLQAVGRARDNELYILFTDLTSYLTDLTPLVAACRVARARHHQVLVILPALGSPTDEKNPATRQIADKGGLSPEQPLEAGEAGCQHLTRRYYDVAYRQLRRQLAAVGVSLLRLDMEDPLPAVLERLDRLRGYRSWR